MPVKNVRNLTPVSSPRRRRLAMWLMLGCVSTTTIVSNGVCLADELDWDGGMSVSAPTAPDKTGSPAFSSPMTDAMVPGADDAKVPTFRPTQSVNSVLGLRPGHADWNNVGTSPVGTSIQLLPSTPPPAPPKQSAGSATDSLSLNPPQAEKPAPPQRLAPSWVTRDNAELRGLPQSWQPAVPTFQTRGPELVLRPVAPEVDATTAPQRSLATPQVLLQPPQQLATQAPSPSQADADGLPSEVPNLNSGLPANTVADRRLFPSWMNPRSLMPGKSSPEPATTGNHAYEHTQPRASVPGEGWQPRGQSIPRQSTLRQPTSSQPISRQPLRDPVPVTVAPPTRSAPAMVAPLEPLPMEPNRLEVSPRNSMPVGSGISPLTDENDKPITLSPVQRMPSLDTLPALEALPDGPGSLSLTPPAELPDERVVEEEKSTYEATTKHQDVSEKVVAETEDSEMSLGAPARISEPTVASKMNPTSRRSSSDKPVQSSSVNANDGNNEGDVAGPLEIDKWYGDEPDDLQDDIPMIELLKDPDSVARSAPAAKPPGEPIKSRPELSATRIKPLVIDPLESQQSLEPLKPVEEKTVLRDVRELYDSSRRGASEPVERIAESPIDRIVNVDATGREKSHSGPGAVANLDPSIARLRSPILQTLRSFHARTENADSRSNWGMMHAIMVYGADTRIIARRGNYSAIAWIAGNNVCRGNRLMTTEHGKLKIREGTGLQGHQAQFLAVLSLAGVPSNYPLHADGKKFSVGELVQVEAAACEEGKELTFTLIGLAHYLDTDATWTGVGGERWDFDRLIAAELNEPIVGAACGGTHRLMGFAHALRKRRLEGEPINGQWKRAEDFLNDFTKYTYSMQNRDGSFSTDWFESREDNGDLTRKVQTTGHMLEFLLTHLPDEDLVDPHVVNAVRFIVGAMGRVPLDDAGVGYRGHALRSLAMYHRRVFGIAPDYPQGNVASGRHQQQRRR
ncbi:ADP-ribosylation factor-directed GTPase activating protein isoform b [Aporhodopirellula aestuarii]|uniref:ADP-ribosylation factor-directed GTPase activating protein isoform b n=1 Tax=Aporhodopirellula aestuarii TaxID=2950107 RepID=A0ABT0U453_9BACT|nr:ADP-ribosylation factor-directed GTPase activating protein isoform b [Aporhodopirellula aestuarii]MCM2371704.1 ADP-ribosylation factor-directed GTPase activating protein isoform b [Aporhodopirellula aestuarii]